MLFFESYWNCLYLFIKSVIKIISIKIIDIQIFKQVTNILLQPVNTLTKNSPA